MGLAKRPSQWGSGASSALMSPTAGDSVQVAAKLIKASSAAVDEMRVEVQHLAAHFVKCMMSGDTLTTPDSGPADDAVVCVSLRVSCRGSDSGDSLGRLAVWSSVPWTPCWTARKRSSARHWTSC
jgi:hypothetical protein